jgi:hypothetical protein
MCVCDVITVGVLICTLYAVAVSVVGGDLAMNLTQLFVAARKLPSLYSPVTTP